jgi:tetrahydromethanopterin S-methyltransferase subunit B
MNEAASVFDVVVTGVVAILFTGLLAHFVDKLEERIKKLEQRR